MTAELTPHELAQDIEALRLASDGLALDESLRVASEMNSLLDLWTVRFSDMGDYTDFLSDPEDDEQGWEGVPEVVN